MFPLIPSQLALGQRLAAATLAALFLGLPAIVYAQDDDGDGADAVEEIVVTGTRIKRRNLVSTSPVTQVDSEELLFQGVTRVEDLLNDLPQVIADQASWTNNGTSGTATVDLRGLQPVRTLTLLNGRRLPAGTPANPVADVNQIPGVLIDRVEVLTGGASATYGSDAIAGVVNFITDTDFEGIQFDYQYSLYTHKNGSPIAQAVIDAGYQLPSKNVSDGNTQDFSVLAGLNTPNRRGNVTLYATWRDVKGVVQAERDYSACAISPFDLSCGGSSTIPEGRFTDFGLLANPPCVMVSAPTPEDPNAMTCNRIPAYDPATGMPTGEVDGNGNLVTVNEPVLPWYGNTTGTGTMAWPGSFDFLVEPGTNTFVNRRGHPNAFYNFAPTNYYMRPDERITAGAFGHYTFSDAAELYLELNYMDDKTVAQLAPSGSFFAPDTVYCGNPLLSQQQFDLLCGRYNLTPDDYQLAFLGRRNAEGGSRRSEMQHKQHRIVLGMRGDLGPTWSYDAYGNYGEVEHSELFDEDLSITRMIRAVDVVTDPGSGAPVCRSVLDGSDPACVPWNVFESGAVTQQALDYITQPLYFNGSTRQIQVSSFVSGDLGDYGIRVPGADEGIKAVFGLEYRDERLAYEPDPAALTGDVAGFGSNVTAIDAGYSIREAFTEASIPILEGKTAAELVSVDLAYRYSDYSTGKATNTYKYAGEWMVHPSLRFRASFQRAVRVGNVNELYRPLQDGFDFGDDTCVGQNPVSTLEECQRTGLSAALYGNLPDPEGDTGFQVQFGGNAELDPEESDTVSFGFLVTPEFLSEFTLSVDYYDIDVQGAIAEPSSQFLFNRCAQTGEARFCDAVSRDSQTGLLFLGDGFIDIRNTNIGAIRTKGVDFVADYVIPLGRSDLKFNLVGTYLESWEWQELPGETSFECAGTYNNGPCARPRPELATNLRTTWITPWNASISLLWRHLSAISDKTVDTLVFDLPSADYYDLSGIWDATDDITLHVGVRNLLDEDPPLAPGGFAGAGNTIPQAYDALGRYWFAGMTLRL